MLRLYTKNASVYAPDLCVKTAVEVQYKWKRCSKKKCCKQCGQVKFKGTMTKWPVQKHTEHHKTQSIPQAYIQL